MSGNVSRNGNIFEDVAIKAPVRLASVLANITLAGLQTIDGVAAAEGDRVLVAAQTDATRNGIWQVSTGNWIRTRDAANNTDLIEGTLVLIAQGTLAGQLYECTCSDSPIVIDTSSISFAAQSTVQTAKQSATSATSQAIGTGSKTFATQAGKSFAADQYVLIFETSAPANAMLAQIASYSGTSLVVNSVATSGSGTHTDWSIVLANSAASAGRMPPIGTGNVAGPGSSVTGHIATFTDTSGKVLGDGGAVGTLASRTTLLYGDAGAASIGQTALVPGSAPLPYCGAQPNDNLHLVNDGTNATRDINVTAGRCRDDSDVTNLHLLGTMVKRLDTAWAAGGAAGSPAGGCDTGTKGANQTWHAFLIAKRSLAITAYSRTSNVATITIAAHGGGAGGTVRAFGMGNGMDALAVISGVATNTISYANTGADIPTTSVSALGDLYDVLGSQSYASPTMPSGWTVKQCLGSFLTDGSGNVRAMKQIGDRFLYATSVQDLSAAAVTTRTNLTLTVPQGVSVEASFRVMVPATSAVYFLYTSLFETDQTPSANFCDVAATGSLSGSGQFSGNLYRLTDTQGRIGRRASGAGATEIVSVNGYRDPRRRMF